MARADRDQQSAGAHTGGGSRESGGNTGGGRSDRDQQSNTVADRAQEATPADHGITGGNPQDRLRYDDFQKAEVEYENRTLLDKILDFVAGPLYNDEQPEWSNPDTYHKGTIHSGTDPYGTAGMVIGSVAGPFLGGPIGGGLLGSEVGSAISDELGSKDIMHNPATDAERADYNMGPAEHSAPNAPPGDRTGQTGGLGLVSDPTVLGSMPSQAAPPNPTVPSTGTTTPAPAQNSPYPTPEELWGKPGQDGSYVLDQSTQRVRFVPA